MHRLSGTEKIFEKILSCNDAIKLTPLRKDVLSIFIAAKKPISAYDALTILKHKRASAEPPTVYRVIEYLVKNKLIHRIDAENKYVFCSQLQKSNMLYHGILFVCTQCQLSFEIADQAFDNVLSALAKTYFFSISDAPTEIKGTCQACAAG